MVPGAESLHLMCGWVWICFIARLIKQRLLLQSRLMLVHFLSPIPFILILPSIPGSLPSQRQAPRGLGSLVPLDLDRDAVIHQAASHHWPGVEQMCEFSMKHQNMKCIFAFSEKIIYVSISSACKQQSLPFIILAVF